MMRIAFIAGRHESLLRRMRSLLAGPGLVGWLLAALLVGHFTARCVHHRAVPLAARNCYPRTYALSLSLIAGHGFSNFPVGPTPACKPADDFLKLERERLSVEELQAAFREPCPESLDVVHSMWDSLTTTRVLDLYVAAGVWKCFGISWQVLFTFYALVSTACCAMIFLITRRLSGDSWAGLAAALLFFAAPLEGQVAARSIRDVNPAWFAIGCCWLLVCVVDTRRSRLGNIVSYAGLGVAAMLGTGWRFDSFLWVPFFGLSMIAGMTARRRGWRNVLLATLLFAGGAAVTRAGIVALFSTEQMAPSTGFHMAVYADYTRSNLLGLENSLQVNRCDAQTLFTARLMSDQRSAGRAEPLIYFDPHYNRFCGELFLDEARYNLYPWIRAFPRFFAKCLSGLSSSDTFYGEPRAQLDSVRIGWLKPVYHGLLDPLTACLPWLAPAGFIALMLRPVERTMSCVVAVFTLYYASALWLVLPETKHLTPMLLPLCVLGGAGLVAVCRALRPMAWRNVELRVLGRGLAWCGGGLALAAICWSVGLLVARPISLAERRAQTAAILALAERSGQDAPSLVRGECSFSVRFEPGEQRGWQGYLLKVATDDRPDELVCRHIRFPRDWLWASLLTTRHRLAPRAEQYFFVSALQGGKYGDPRPYQLRVDVGREARIVSCTKIDLADWKRLPVSTVFRADEDQPGSPDAAENNSTFAFAVPPPWPSTIIGEVACMRKLAEMPWQPTTRLPASARPLDHLLGRDPSTGAWWLGVNYGATCLGRAVDELTPTDFGPATEAGDFNGDGAADLVTWNRQTGAVQVAVFNGTGYDCRDWATWPSSGLGELLVGDFNGDGLDDILVADRKHRRWQAGIFRGNRFEIETWGACDGNTSEPELLAGDFTGDGRTDLVERSAAGGRLRVWRSTAGSLVAEDWGAWNELNASSPLHRGDFNGDGRLDLAALDARTGRWTVALAADGRFDIREFGHWPADREWVEISVGDFDGDGLDDLAGRDRQTGQIRAGRSTGHSFEERPIAPAPAEIAQLVAGDFNGDGRSDLAGRVASSGLIWIAFSEESTFRWQWHGGWLNTAGIGQIKPVNFWRPVRASR